METNNVQVTTITKTLPGLIQEKIFEHVTTSGFKKGIRVDKGVILTENYINENWNNITSMIQKWTAYPDIFLDTIETEATTIKLLPYQRIFLRAIMRYRTVYVCACRAWSKSFLTILAMILQCIFMPGTKRFICAPGKGQGIMIAKEKCTEIFTNWPLLKREVNDWQKKDIPGNYSTQGVEINFNNGSKLDVVGAMDSTRGGRRNGGLVDEVRDHDGDMLSQVVLPLLNVSRRLPSGKVNPKEPNQQVIYATSAGSKLSFAYGQLIDVLERTIIDPKSAFCMGNDYRVPLMHGLLSQNFVRDLKLSPTYNEQTFASEYGSIWTGGSEESWFNLDKLLKHRRLKKVEYKARSDSGQSADMFYLIAVDVGRLNDLSIATIIRVNVNSLGIHGASVVNIKTLGLTKETRTFEQQSISIKKLIEEYNPRGVIVDTNGLGVGLGEWLIKEQTDILEGKVYPAYGFNDDKEFINIQPAQAPRILWSMKASSGLKPQIVANAYNRINQGVVQFLIDEGKAKIQLQALKKYNSMTVEEKLAYLVPYESTSRLIEEIMNQRLKAGSTIGGSNIVVENINTSMHDDRFMSLCYGLWLVKQFEDNYKLYHRRGYNRTLMFVN